MALTVSHKFVSLIADQGDPTLFGPDEWNDTHDITGSEFTTISASTTFYVATTGSDVTGTGSVGAPWRTLQHAADTIVQGYRNPFQYTITVNVADGTYDENASGYGLALTSEDEYGPNVTFVGNTTTRANCVIRTSAGNPINVQGGVWRAYGFTLNPQGLGACVTVSGKASYLLLYAVALGTVDAGNSHCNITTGGTLVTDDVEIIGTATNYFWVREHGASAYHSHDQLKLTVDPGWAGGTFYVGRQAFVHFNTDAPDIIGTSSGKKFTVEEGGRLQTDMAESLIPGAVAGTCTDGFVSCGNVYVHPAFGGDSGAGGTMGLVPAPAVGDALKLLRGDGAWVAAGSTANLIVGTSTITSGTTTHVPYNNAGIYGEAANFTISSGNPNVTAGNAYLYDGKNAVFSVAHASGDNWFLGEAGNLTVTGYANIGIGFGACSALTTGIFNFGCGLFSLTQITSGSYNSGLGISCLQYITGSFNTGMGQQACAGIAFGGSNTGSQNTATGYAAGANITSGSYNVADGFQALGNTSAGITGSYNVGVGQTSLPALTSGIGNVCVGAALPAVTTADTNVAVGYNAGSGVTGTGNTIIGGGFTQFPGPFAGATITSGAHNIVVGAGSDVSNATADGQLSIGNYIYGTGLTGSGSTVSTAKIGIGVKSPACQLDVDGTVKTKVYTVATLPTVGVQGARALVTDATVTTFASIVAGTGGNIVPVFDDGTNWRIG